MGGGRVHDDARLERWRGQRLAPHDAATAAVGRRGGHRVGAGGGGVGARPPLRAPAAAGRRDELVVDDGLNRPGCTEQVTANCFSRVVMYALEDAAADEARAARGPRVRARDRRARREHHAPLVAPGRPSQQ